MIARIDVAAAAALDSPFPDPATARTHVVAELRPMKLTYAAAMADALVKVARADPELIFIGNGWVGLNVAAREAFGEFDAAFGHRVVNKPVSELGIAGAGIGAALAGCRTMVDMSTADFLYQAFPQIVDEAATVRYSTAGASHVPVTFYAMAGVRGGGAAQHSARPQAMLAGVPGLQVVLPSSPADVHGLLRWSLLHSEDPTVFITHPVLFGDEEDVDVDAPPIPFGRARVRRRRRRRHDRGHVGDGAASGDRS